METRLLKIKLNQKYYPPMALSPGLLKEN